ncbi:hypothetical protein ES706_05659 [subsurface metagenome]
MNIKSIIQYLLPYIKNFRIFSFLINLIDYRINIIILKKKEVVRKVNNYPMVLSFHEKGISHGLFINRVREIAETEILKEILKPGMCILEIGANIGYYTILMGKIIGKTGKIYLYEPYFPSFKILMKNIKLNNISTIVEANNLAVSNETKIKKFYLGKASNVHSLINYSSNTNNPNYIKVKTIDINEVLRNINRKIDLLRMDIEGHEREIFKRLSKDNIHFLPKRIFFEIHPIGDIHPDPTFKSPLSNILNLGYFPELVVSSSNVNAYKRFKNLNYHPFKIVGNVHNRRYLYKNIKRCDLLKIAASRPKMTRAVLLKLKE